MLNKNIKEIQTKYDTFVKEHQSFDSQLAEFSKWIKNVSENAAMQRMENFCFVQLKRIAPRNSCLLIYDEGAEKQKLEEYWAREVSVLITVVMGAVLLGCADRDQRDVVTSKLLLYFVVGQFVDPYTGATWHGFSSLSIK